MTVAATRSAIEAVWRIESARLIGALLRMVRDIGLAEDLAQEALFAALERKHERVEQHVSDDARAFPELEAAIDEDIGDDRLRLILVARHSVLICSIGSGSKKRIVVPRARAASWSSWLTSTCPWTLTATWTETTHRGGSDHVRQHVPPSASDQRPAPSARLRTTDCAGQTSWSAQSPWPDEVVNAGEELDCAWIDVRALEAQHAILSASAAQPLCTRRALVKVGRPSPRRRWRPGSDRIGSECKGSVRVRSGEWIPACAIAPPNVTTPARIPTNGMRSASSIASSCPRSQRTRIIAPCLLAAKAAPQLRASPGAVQQSAARSRS